MDADVWFCLGCQRRFGADAGYCPDCGLELVSEWEWTGRRMPAVEAPAGREGKSAPPAPVSAPPAGTRFCLSCLRRFEGTEEFCPDCGVELAEVRARPAAPAPKEYNVADVRPKEAPPAIDWRPTELWGKSAGPPRPLLPDPKGVRKVQYEVGKYLPGLVQWKVFLPSAALGGFGLYYSADAFADMAGVRTGGGSAAFTFPLILMQVLLGSLCTVQAMVWLIRGELALLLVAIMEMTAREWLIFFVLSLWTIGFTLLFLVPLMVRQVG